MPISFRATIDAAPLSRLQWAVAAMVTTVLFVDGLDYQIAAYAAPAMMAEWRLTKPQFAPLLAAAMIGMAVGTLIGSWSGDRYGRRPTLVVSVAFFGVMTLVCATVAGSGPFLACRLIGGLGLGAAFPVALTTMSEWMPRRVAGKAVSIMTIGIPAGIIVGALAASWILPHLGWRGFFVCAGSLCFVSALLLLWKLPESPAYLILRNRHERAHSLLASAWHGPVGDGRQPFHLEVRSSSERGLVARQNLRTNAGLWLGCGSINLATYAVGGWLTVILVGLHLPLQTALRGPVAYSVSAILGTISVGWLISRWGSRAVMVALSAIAIAGGVGISGAIHALPIDGTLLPAIFGGLVIEGFSIGGLLSANFVVAAFAYATPIRARGIGVASAVGRVGAILSSFAGGAVLALGQGAAFFAMVASLAVLAMAGILVVNRHIPARGRPAGVLGADSAPIEV